MPDYDEREYIKIGSKKYYWTRSLWYSEGKLQLQRLARRYRKEGYLCRVIKKGNLYSLYMRPNK